MAGTRTKDWAEVDFYAILGVAPEATEEDIGRAYRLLAKQLHPDAGATGSQTEQFKEVSAAYAVLKDVKVRRDYDLVRSDVLERKARATPRPAPVVAQTVYRPTGAFRAATPSRGWTKTRSWLAVIGGTLTTILGVIVAIVVVDLRMHSGDPGVQPDAARDITLAIVALKLLIGGPVFAVIGALHLRGRPLPRFVVIAR